MWFSAIPCIWTVVVGTIVSLLFKPQDPKTLNPDLVSPGFYHVFSFWPKFTGINKYIKSLGIGSLWVIFVSIYMYVFKLTHIIDFR